MRHIKANDSEVACVAILPLLLMGCGPSHRPVETRPESTATSPKNERISKAIPLTAVVAIKFAPNGRHLSWADLDGTVHIVTWRNGVIGKRSSFRRPDIVRSITWSRDSRYVAVGSEPLKQNYSVGLWNTETGKTQKVITGGNGNSLSQIAWSPTSDALAVVSDDLEIWDVPSGKLLRRLNGGKCIAWSPNGQYLACGDYTGRASIWDVASAKLVTTLSNGLKEEMAIINFVAWSPDGKYLATAGNDMIRVRPGVVDSTVRVWNVETGKQVRILHGYAELMGKVVWSPDGKSVSAVGRGARIRTWDRDTGQELSSFQVQGEAVDWSPDRSHVAVGQFNGGVSIVNATNGKPVLVVRQS